MLTAHDLAPNPPRFIFFPEAGQAEYSLAWVSEPGGRAALADLEHEGRGGGCGCGGGKVGMDRRRYRWVCKGEGGRWNLSMGGYM